MCGGKLIMTMWLFTRGFVGMGLGGGMMKWTNVKDGLPEELKLCIVIYDNGRYNLDRYYGDGEFAKYVEWWMPVPRAPEEEEG
jgi:hypothetical protein